MITLGSRGQIRVGELGKVEGPSEMAENVGAGLLAKPKDLSPWPKYFYDEKGSHGNGGRIYKKRQVRQERPREDWIAIPVPAFLPRELVDGARASLESNKGTERRFLARSWELKGLLHCSCGSRMRTHTV